MDIELKPCPFCGCNVQFKDSCVNFGKYSINGFKIKCDCGIETRNRIYDYDGRTENDLKLKLAEKWNRRIK